MRLFRRPSTVPPRCTNARTRPYTFWKETPSAPFAKRLGLFFPAKFLTQIRNLFNSNRDPHSPKLATHKILPRQLSNSLPKPFSPKAINSTPSPLPGTILQTSTSKASCHILLATHHHVSLLCDSLRLPTSPPFLVSNDTASTFPAPKLPSLPSPSTAASPISADYPALWLAQCLVPW